MNRHLLLASLILVGMTLLILAVAASIRPPAAEAHSVHSENQSAIYTPLYTASPVWSNVPLTDPSIDGTLLTDVTVDSAGTVWAVGVSGNNLVVISSTNAGTSWFTSTQNLGVSSELLGIAAVSPTNIFAVGDYMPTGGTNEKTLVLHYNGGSWSPVTSASFSGYDTRLVAVAATPSGDVWAVGRIWAFGGASIWTLVERWDSATNSFVTVTSSSLDTRPQNELYDVALTAANNVWVVGYSDSRGLIAHWNGTSWTSNPYPDATYEGIALDPDADARVVGYSSNGGSKPLMARYHLNGSAINLSAAFVDTRLTGSNFLFGVAVTTTNDVWAVGNYTVTEHYDGLSFELVPAELMGTTAQWLYRVAIDPVRDGAWAVGHYSDGSGLHPLVERYARPVTPQPPKHTVTYYVKDPNLLYTQGANARLGITAGVVILAFGKPAAQNNISGTILPEDPNGTLYPIGKIAAAVEQFADGYYNGGQPVGWPQPIIIAIGTSNLQISQTDVMADTGRAFDHGKAWAQMVNQVSADVYTLGYSSLIQIAGASDMELAWNFPDKTIAWANGYTAAASHFYYNFGDCPGCPGAPLTNTWTYTNVYTVSWGITRAVPFPQIYRTDAVQARQWQQVAALTRNLQPFGLMKFAGSLTQQGACIIRGCDPTITNPPATGWTQLWQALNFDPITVQDLRWSSDITYNAP